VFAAVKEEVTDCLLRRFRNAHWENPSIDADVKTWTREHGRLLRWQTSCYHIITAPSVILGNLVCSSSVRRGGEQAEQWHQPSIGRPNIPPGWVSHRMTGPLARRMAHITPSRR